MSLNVAEAVGDGARRTIKQNGLILVTVAFVVQITSSIGLESLFPEQTLVSPGVPTIDVDYPMWLTALGASGVVLVFVVSYRVFYTGETATVPRRAYTKDIGFAFINLLFGTVAFLIIVGFGYLWVMSGQLLFVDSGLSGSPVILLSAIPGVFLHVSLFFYTMYISVEHQHFPAALEASWNLTGENRLSVFGLLAVVCAASALWVAVGSVFQPYGGLVHWFAIDVTAAIAMVFVAAITARAFIQLQQAEPGEPFGNAEKYAPPPVSEPDSSPSGPSS